MARFEGNGNCNIINGNNRRRGWQVICCICGRIEKRVATGKHSPVPAVEIFRRFTQQGWQIGNTPADDTCPKCLEDRRTDAMKIKRARNANTQLVDDLHDSIRNLDAYMNKNVGITRTLEFQNGQIDLIKAFKSLMETAFCFEILAKPEAAATVEIDETQELRRMISERETRIAENDQCIAEITAELERNKREIERIERERVVNIPVEPSLPKSTPKPEPAKSQASPKVVALREQLRKLQQHNGSAR